jgi:hypothetical protein
MCMSCVHTLCSYRMFIPYVHTVCSYRMFIPYLSLQQSLYVHLFQVEKMPEPTTLELKKKSYKNLICGKINSLQRLLKTRELPADRQRIILKQLTAVEKILENESVIASDVITHKFPRGEIMNSKGKIMPLVSSQYPKFGKKKSRDIVRTSMKAFKNSSANRENHANSYKLGLGLPTSSCGDVNIQQHSFKFSVKKSKMDLHVDGIIFGPTIGGIVVGVITSCPYHLYVHEICSYHMFIPHVHTICSYHMFIPYVHTTCSYHMFVPYVHAMHSDHMFIPCVYITCSHHMFRCEWPSRFPTCQSDEGQT